MVSASMGVESRTVANTREEMAGRECAKFKNFALWPIFTRNQTIDFFFACAQNQISLPQHPDGTDICAGAKAAAQGRAHTEVLTG
jgi:hypothetical protein